MRQRTANVPKTPYDSEDTPLRRRLRRLGGPLLLLFSAHVASGCAGLAPAFDPRFGDNDDARSARVLERIAQGGDTAASELRVVATTDAPAQELISADLAQGIRFRSKVSADSRPELLGDLVLVSTGGELRAFDARDGHARWSRPLEGCARYLGAARDGDVIAFACEAPAGEKALAGAAPSVLRAIAAGSGRLVWERETPDALGRPASSHGLLLVPWQRQGLALLDARDGVELARLRSRDDVIDWVRAEPGYAWFGHRQAYLIGPRGYSGSRKDAFALGVAAETLPGRPALVESAFSALPGKRSAHGRVALHVAPELAGDRLVARDGRVYFTFYRYVFAYDAAGALLWSRTLAQDAISARAIDGGLALVTATGDLLLLAAGDGSEQGRRALGVQLAAATIYGQGRVPAATVNGPAPSLRKGLLEVALDIDQRLVPARAYAVDQLARLPEPEVTADLLHIYGRSTTPPELQRVVADALRTRRTGLEHTVDALLQRYDFIEQTRPAPLAVLVPALLDARETRAVPNLVARMLDHETPLAVLGSVVHAVVELGDPRVVEPLLRFLRWYRADSTFAEQPDALLEAARGVLRHGGDAGAQKLAALVRDGIATPALGSEIAVLLAPKPEATPGTAVAAAPAAPARPLPASLGSPELRAAFDSRAGELRGCLLPELERNPKLAQVRIALIVESDGSTHALQVAPASGELVDCVYAKLANLRFPRFRSGRQVATYVLPVRARESAAPDAESAPGEAVFWAFAASHPRELTGASEPWWHAKQSIAALAMPPAQPGSGAKDNPAAKQPANNPAAAPRGPAAPAAPPAAAQGAAAPAVGPVAGAPAPPAAPAAEAPAAEDAWWVPAAK